MNKLYYFPLHLDGGNRGCEGIAKGTAKILHKSKEQLIGYCSDVYLDQKLGVSDCFSLLDSTYRPTIFERIIRKIEALFSRGLYEKQYVYTKFNYKKINSLIKESDYVLFTGGDLLCYKNLYVVSINTSIALKKHAKRILWGCSMGEEDIDPIKLETLKKFNLIYARESLTFQFFTRLGLKNVVCLPDPAFVLEPQETILPDCFSANTVIGINLSTFTVGSDKLDTSFGSEIKKLINYILSNTDYHILLIPHVFWNKQDDRLISNDVLQTYQYCRERFTLLNSEDLNYLQIRYVISKCHMFIGARTHAMISAYSTCVPSIALGYSIKSRGIVKDIGLSENLVVDTRNYEKNVLLNSFIYLSNNYKRIKEHLDNIMVEYKKKAYKINNYL